MTCLHCGAAIPREFITALEPEANAGRGLFRCPSCHTQHVRRAVGTLPSGETLYALRLWGHLTTARRKVVTPPTRAKRTRLKWRARPAEAGSGEAS